MIADILSVFGIICIAIVVGKIAAKVKLPSILGWLVTGIVFGPYLVGVVSFETMDSMWYKIAIKVIECLAGVMIGKEIVFKKLASSGRQIIGITFIQSIGTFLVVSLVFGAVFLFMGIPVYLAFVFGGIALATAPAPALSIVNEYHTSGDVTKTLIPLAAIDDVIGVAVFFTVISVIVACIITLVKEHGGIDFVLNFIKSRISDEKGGELGIAALALLVDVCTANNTVAIVMAGPIAKDISTDFGVTPRRSASLLDMFSSMGQGLIPYGAQLLSAASLTKLTPFDIIPYCFYPLLMGLSGLVFIFIKKRTA